MLALLLGPAGKVNVNSPAKNGLTALHLAAQENHLHIAEVLFNHSCTIDSQTKVTQLGSLLLLLLLLQMSIIMVALSHYCCRTTLQCHCHVSQTKQQPQYICPQLFSRNTKNVSIHRETLPKQHSLQFPTEGE